MSEFGAGFSQYLGFVSLVLALSPSVPSVREAPGSRKECSVGRPVRLCACVCVCACVSRHLRRRPYRYTAIPPDATRHHPSTLSMRPWAVRGEHDASPPPLATSASGRPTWDRRQLRQMAAGGGAGIVAKTVVAPFERVKIVCQTGESVGMLATTARIWSSEGIVGFWRGNLAACVRVVPHKAILFAFSDFYKDLFRSQNASGGGALPVWGAFAAGSLSGFTASVATYPLDLIRTRVSGQIGSERVYHGIMATFLRTLREEGPRALFRGIGPTLFGSLPYEGLKFGSYDLLTQLLPADVDPKADFAGKIICGGGAGMVATVLTYPNDTVRRRLQMQGAGGVARKYRHAWDCYVQLARHEGFAAYYRGLTPTLVRAMPNMGVQFATYDVLKQLLADL